MALCFSQESKLPAPPAEWDSLVSAALYHGVAPFLWQKLRDRDLPPAVRDRFKALYVANSVSNEILKKEQDGIVEALARQSVPAWPLKGVDLSEALYEDIGARQVSDIDLLIRPDDLETADRVLADLDYDRSERGGWRSLQKARELLYLKSTERGVAFVVDLHQRLMPRVRHDRLAEQVWSQGMIREHLLLYLCINHVSDRFAKLKYLLDITMLVDRGQDVIDWDLVVSTARELPFAPGIHRSLESASALGAAVPETALTTLCPGRLNRKLLRWILGDDRLAALELGEELAGPFGALAVWASTRGTIARLRQMWRMLFPPSVYLEETHGARGFTRAVYLKRLHTKLPGVSRGLARRTFPKRRGRRRDDRKASTSIERNGLNTR